MPNNDPFRDSQGTRIAGKDKQPTGAGAEAAEGLHARRQGRDQSRDETDRSALTDRETGDDGEQRGSEPLTESDQHESAYGGDAGAPKRGYESSGKRDERDERGPAGR